MRKIKRIQYENKYQENGSLGEGGNGKVCRCVSKNSGEVVAVKLLENLSNEKKARFKREIAAIQHLQSYKGVMPMIEFDETEFWYAMPCATSITEHIKACNLGLVGIVDITISLSETLCKIHSQGISHRDIKPANILYYNGVPCFGDFGLCDYDNTDAKLTNSEKGIGAIFTIAPEMKRNPQDADGKKADVFSMGKTLWMLLVDDERGFDGTYDCLNPKVGLHYFEKYRDEHLSEIEQLLERSTSDNPDYRPTIEVFCDKLKEWKTIYLDTLASQQSDWHYLNRYLFGDIPQESATWIPPKAIVDVLKRVSLNPSINHMLFPQSGGLDLWGADLAAEDGFIHFYTSGYDNIIKPQRLTFQSFKDFRWNYFLLEAEEVPYILNSDNGYGEYLVEDIPGHYVSAEYAQYGVYDYDSGMPFPKGFRMVERFQKGNFLIVMKSGPYNRINATYDGRHNDCTAEEFKQHVKYLISKVEEGIEQGYSESEIISDINFGRSPFPKDNPLFIPDQEEKQYAPKSFYSDLQNLLDFSSIIHTYQNEESPVEFSFAVKGLVSRDDEFLDLLDGKEFYICKNGQLCQTTIHDENVLHIKKRSQAIRIVKGLDEIIKNIFMQNGYEPSGTVYCDVKLRRIGNPCHLFTKYEIKDLMIQADDRVDNALVIDEYGYARIVNNPQEKLLYPVSQEIWCAGKVYVGKYSHLSDLNQSYTYMLNGWLDYLRTNMQQNVEYLDLYNDKLMEQEILAYYIRNGICIR